MKKLFRVLKINVISIFAILFLLVSIAFKLIGKAVERFVAFCVLIAAYFLIRYLAKADLFPKSGVAWAISSLVAIAILVGLFFLLRWLGTQLSSTFIPMGNAVISAFDWLFDVTYNKYLHYYTVCENDFKYLSQAKSQTTANACLCLFYSLLKGLSWLVITLVSLSLPLAIASCVGLIVITLWKLNTRVRTAFGMSFFQFIKKFESSSATTSMLCYFFMMILLCLLILIVALEWHGWAKEVRMSSSKMNMQVHDLVTNYLPIANQATTNTGKGSEYTRKIQAHVATLSAFGQQVQSILEKDDNALLRSYWGNYMRNLTTVTKGCFSEKALPYEKLKPFIPKIKLLDRKKNDVQKLLAKLGVDLSQQATLSVPAFFADCDTLKKLEEQYKLLYKAYHPASPSGNEATFKKMQAEYESMKKKLQTPAK